MSSLASACICVQKFHHDPVVHGHISKRIVEDNFAKAVFLDASIWPKGSVVRVSFLTPNSDVMPEWYTLESVEKYLNSDQMELERAARQAATFEDAVKLIVNTVIVPIVQNYVKFDFVQEGEGDVRVRFDKTGGSSSLVGTNCLKSNEPFTMTFGWMDVGTIIHEFSHALGMLHEHQNPKGGIQWNRAAVYAWAAETQGWDEETTDANILSALPVNEISGSAYDPKSVMAYFFPAELTLDGSSFTRNLRYSDTDYTWLIEKYGGNVAVAKKSGSGGEPVQKKPINWRLYILLAVFVLIMLLVIFLQ